MMVLIQINELDRIRFFSFDTLIPIFGISEFYIDEHFKPVLLVAENLTKSDNIRLKSLMKNLHNKWESKQKQLPLF